MFDLLPEEMELINLDYMTAIAYIAIVLLLVLIIYMQKLFALLEKTTQAEKKMKQLQTAYYRGLLEKEEETRRYRHDMHNQRWKEIDLCTIFANLIQNAAEELEKQVEDDCFLAVELKQGEENTQIIIRNTASLILEENRKKIKTSKKDGKNHGIGLENIRETVERYGGVLSLSADGREFKAVVTIKV